MITREEIEALSEGDLAALHTLVVSVHRLRAFKDTASARLARLAVGESTLFEEWRESYRLNANVTRCARTRLRAPDAVWSASATNKGVRVTRIA